MVPIRVVWWSHLIISSSSLWRKKRNKTRTLIRKVQKQKFNPRPDTVFATFGRTGGGATPPPWCFQTKRRRTSRKRPADCSRRVLAIGGIIFGPRSIFDPVMAGQRSIFRKFYDFSNLRVDISKAIYRSGMGPSPACSPFNSA